MQSLKIINNFLRSLFIAGSAIMFLAAFDKNSLTTTAALDCSLKADKKVYKIGQLPKLSVEIRNNTSKDIYLIGALDDSDERRRMPYCYFTIKKPKPDTVKLGRCGFVNPLRLEDFVLVKSGQAFDPYERIDHYGFFIDPTITNPETFKNPGVYHLQFHYSTNSDQISKFMFDSRFGSSKSDSAKIALVFDKVPKVDLESNEIELEFEN